MPDISPEGVHKFWSEYDDSMIYRVVSFMEGVEEWAHSGEPELEAALTELGQELENLGSNDINKEDEWIKLCCHLKTARALRLLQCLDTAHPGAASKLLIYAEESSREQTDTPGTFLRRNIVFERLRLLSRVFSEERFNLVLKAMENEDV